MTITAKFCIIALLALLVSPVLADTGPIRPTTTTTLAPISNPHYTNMTGYFGGNASYTAIPNFGKMIEEPILVYVDKIGVLAWVIIMAVPFIMMWICGGDLITPAVTGLVVFGYVMSHVPNETVWMIAVGGIALFVAALLWSLYRRAY